MTAGSGGTRQEAVRRVNMHTNIQQGFSLKRESETKRSPRLAWLNTDAEEIQKLEPRIKGKLGANRVMEKKRKKEQAKGV